MPNLFDEFDLELQKINMEITPCSDSASDSIAVCSGSSTSSFPTSGPTCWNVCNLNDVK